jgi:hypothetical protein
MKLRSTVVLSIAKLFTLRESDRAIVIQIKAYLPLQGYVA